MTNKQINNKIEALIKERKDLSTGSEWNQGVFAGIEMVRETLLA